MKKRSNRSTRCLVALLVLAAITSGCETKRAGGEPGAPGSPPARSLTPAERHAQASAAHWVSRAKQSAFGAAMRQARGEIARAERDQAPARPEAIEREGQPLTLLFSANNHGEREDCGCRKNPLGGLARRATLIDLAQKTSSSELAERLWQGQQPDGAPTFLVDVGDALFPHVTIKSSPKPKRDEAARHAEAVIAAMNVRAPDAMNVGEVDLALGLEALLKLSQEASFPLISANLKRIGQDEPPLPGHVLVERGGLRVAFIGVLKRRARVADFYAQQGVEVSDPIEAYRRELAALSGPIDAVVLLSNEGVPATEQLLKELVGAGARVDLALASNSNTLTRAPRWVKGVPLLEPLSRGKHFGRVDIWRRGAPGEALDYMNNAPSALIALDAHRDAWTSYLRAAYELNKTQDEIARLELEQGAASAEGSDPLKALRATAETLERRVALTSQEALDVATASARQLDASGDDVMGGSDDWIEAHIVPVLLEIEQERATRAALDAAR